MLKFISYLLLSILISVTLFAEDGTKPIDTRSSILKTPQFYIATGYANLSQTASNYYTGNVQGFNISLGVSPFAGKYSSPFRFAMDFIGATSTHTEEMRMYETGREYTGKPPYFPTSRNKRIEYANTYSFTMFYDITKIWWGNKYPQLYFGTSYGRGYFSANVPFSMVSTGEAPHIPPGRSSGQFDYHTEKENTTVTSFIVGTSYQIPKTSLAAYAEYRYNYSVPPKFATSKTVEVIPDEIDKRMNKGKPTKDYTSEGIVVGLKYLF